MFRFLQRFGRDRQASRRGAGPMSRVRRRNRQLNCEALESRQLLSGYYIVNEASGKVLDNSPPTAMGPSSISGSLYGGTNQQWNLVPLANGTYAIRTSQSGYGADRPPLVPKGTQDQSRSRSWGDPNQEWTVYLGAGQEERQLCECGL